MASDREELYILRVQDRALAERLRKFLRADPSTTEQPAPSVSIDWDESQIETGAVRKGTFTVDEEKYSLYLQDLPAIVEAYKTYDDINLVKIEDVGQVLVVQDASAPAPESGEARNGVTAAMRDARRRHFKPEAQLEADLIQRVEEDLLTIVSGSAPEGVEYIDVEEEFVVDADGNGSWQVASSKKAAAAMPEGGEAGAGRETPEPNSLGPGTARAKKAKKPRKSQSAAQDLSISREEI